MVNFLETPIYKRLLDDSDKVFDGAKKAGSYNPIASGFVIFCLFSTFLPDNVFDGYNYDKVNNKMLH